MMCCSDSVPGMESFIPYFLIVPLSHQTTCHALMVGDKSLQNLIQERGLG